MNIKTIAMNSALLVSIGFASGHLEGQDEDEDTHVTTGLLSHG